MEALCLSSLCVSLGYGVHLHGNHVCLWAISTVASRLVRLEKLLPSSQYVVFVQLSRHGNGGTGYPGPEATFSTMALGDVYTP